MVQSIYDSFGMFGFGLLSDAAVCFPITAEWGDALVSMNKAAAVTGQCFEYRTHTAFESTSRKAHSWFNMASLHMCCQLIILFSRCCHILFCARCMRGASTVAHTRLISLSLIDQSLPSRSRDPPLRHSFRPTNGI